MEQKGLDKDKTRCKECGFSYYTHASDCKVLLKERWSSDTYRLFTGKSGYFVNVEKYS
jgi:hypothetical protein